MNRALPGNRSLLTTHFKRCFCSNSNEVRLEKPRLQSGEIYLDVKIQSIDEDASKTSLIDVKVA